MNKAIQFVFDGKFSPTEQSLFEKVQFSDLKKICKYLQVNSDNLGQIKYFVFDTHQGKIDADPNHSVSKAVARFNENAVFRFWDKIEDPSFPHELTHLVAHHFTTPYHLHTEVDQANGEKLTIDIDMVSSSFMQEGLAIAVDDIIFKRKLKEKGEFKMVDEWCKEQLAQMPQNLTEAMEGFDTLPNEVIIPFTASFSKFLLNQYGVGKYKLAYTKQKEIQTIRENIQTLENIYGADSNLLLDSWKNSLKK